MADNTSIEETLDSHSLIWGESHNEVSTQGVSMSTGGTKAQKLTFVFDVDVVFFVQRQVQ